MFISARFSRLLITVADHERSTHQRPLLAVGRGKINDTSPQSTFTDKESTHQEQAVVETAAGSIAMQPAQGRISFLLSRSHVQSQTSPCSFPPSSSPSSLSVLQLPAKPSVGSGRRRHLRRFYFRRHFCLVLPSCLRPCWLYSLPRYP